MQDIVFISLENWDEIWRRNQFVCAELSQRYPQGKILFVGLPHDNSHALRRGRFSQLRASKPQPLDEFPNIFLFNPAKLWPNSIDAGRKANEATFRGQVKAAAQQLGLKKPLLWINAHSAAHMVAKMDECGVIYDITDDWTSANAPPATQQLIVEQDAALCRLADATIVCSQRLFEMKQATARNLTLIANGVDLEHYAGVADGTTVPDASTAKWNRPVLGYVGTIHPERVDVALVEKLARAFPQGTIALVGPDLLTDADRERLLATGNVVLLGPVSYQRVPQILAAFDVCLVPHVESQFTESLNPIKLWEYLACGKTIVSTNVAGFRDFPTLCRIASGAEAYIEACQAALSEAQTPVAAGLKVERLRTAQSNSWSSRVDDVEKVLALAEKGAS